MDRPKIIIPGPLGQRTKPAYQRALLPWSLLLSAALPRFFDILSSFLLIILLLPLLLLRAVIALLHTGQLFHRHLQIGFLQKEFARLSFAGSLPGKRLAILFNILRGDLAWAGPRALEPEELATLPASALFRFALKPGVFSPYGLRKKIGLAYDDELTTEHEFYYSATAKQHIGLSLRGALSSVLGGSTARPTPAMLHFWGGGYCQYQHE